MILVTGATGTVGREVVAQLLLAGEKVRALTRNSSRAHLDEKVELVAGDLNQPETLAKAVGGVERIFSLALGPQLGIQEASLAQAAKKAGARHIVNQGKVFSNYGDGKLTYIHPRDIAAVAVRALTEPGHEGKAYPVTGPEALSVSELVQLLSEAVGKPIEYVPITDDVARDGMQKAGLPSFLIDAFLPFVRT